MTAPLLQTMTVEQLRQEADRCQQKIDRLHDEYGTGVRPEWVGEDIGFETAWRDRYLQEIERRNGQ